MTAATAAQRTGRRVSLRVWGRHRAAASRPDLDASGSSNRMERSRSRVASTALSGGEMLAGELYVALPESPVEIGWRCRAADGAWKIERLHGGAGTLHLEASARIEPAAPVIGGIDLRVAIPR